MQCTRTLPLNMRYDTYVAEERKKHYTQSISWSQISENAERKSVKGRN